MALNGLRASQNQESTAHLAVGGPSKSGGTAAPVKKVRKYIPPHLRKRLGDASQNKPNISNFGQNTAAAYNSQTNNQPEMVRSRSLPGTSQDLRESNFPHDEAPSIAIPNGSGGANSSYSGSPQNTNRFNKNNLYKQRGNMQQFQNRGGFNDNNHQRANNGYRSPGYVSNKRQSFAPPMRRSRSVGSYPNRGTNRFQNRDRSRAANPELEEELFGGEVVTQGINFDIYDKIPVEVSGNSCPTPVDEFSDTLLPPQVVANIKLAGFTKPTPVQRYSIPAGLERRDLMSCAQTGSGKTAAFLVPIISRLILEGRAEEVVNKQQSFSSYGKSWSKYQVHSLLLSPTRELAQQIHLQARKFLYRTGLRSVVVYGGADIKEQFRELNKGCEVLVATPGRLVDFLERGRMSLAKVLVLCMDEADRMLDMGFEPQIRQIVDRYDMPSRDNGRQTLMFSATFPREIQILAQDYLLDYIFLAVGRVGSSTDLISQKLQYCQNHNKVEALMDVLPECHGLTLIFVATRRDADRIENILCEEGVNARSIHGDRTQWEREAALNDFRTGKCPVLVATDVAARGLDIPSVMWVINYDLPNQIDAYVHRIGRTGRCGNRGNALSFVNEGNKPVLRDLLHALRECRMTVPNWFVTMVDSLSYGGGDRRGKRKGSKFGARDARRGNGRGGGNRSSGGQQNRNNGNRNGGLQGGQGGGGGRGDYKTKRQSSSNDAW